MGLFKINNDIICVVYWPRGVQLVPQDGHWMRNWI